MAAKSRLSVDELEVVAAAIEYGRNLEMSRRFEDPSLAGMRVLEVWASQDEKRRFEIRWEGPRRVLTGKGKRDGTAHGGYEVAVWVEQGRVAPVLRRYSGRTLHEAALEATRSAE
jgi:hypothetical protein